MEDGSLSIFSEGLNAQGSAEITRAASRFRRLILGASASVLKRVLEYQYFESQFANAPGDKMTFWSRSSSAPKRFDGRPSAPTWSFMLNGPEQEDETRQKLRIHVPVPQKFEVGNLSDIQRLRRPAAVYPERIAQSASGEIVTARLVVATTGYNMFDTDNTDPSLEPDKWIPKANDSTNPHIGDLAELYADMTSGLWQISAQKEITLS